MHQANHSGVEFSCRTNVHCKGLVTVSSVLVKKKPFKHGLKVAEYDFLVIVSIIYIIVIIFTVYKQ